MLKVWSKKRREKGAGSVEFALALPVFFLLSVGAIDFGRAIWLDHELDSLARDAARFASVRSRNSALPTSTTEIDGFIRRKALAMFDEHLDINTRWTPSNSPGATVEVTLNYRYEPVLGLLPIGPTTLQGDARMIVSN
jgi:Flp pilus assembly protein TadG